MPDDYRWIQMFGIQSNDLNAFGVGDMVQVAAKNGDVRTVSVVATWEYTTKGGKTILRGATQDL